VNQADQRKQARSTTPCWHESPHGHPLNDEAENAVAQRISSVLALDEAKGGGGVPSGLARGILGVVGDPSAGYTVVADTTRLDIQRLHESLTEGLPPQAASAVRVEGSCTSAAALATAWRKLEARDWHPSAKRAAFGFDIDARTEQIVVGLDAGSAGPELAEAIQRIAPRLISIHLVPASRSSRGP
jgi:hypothetical protein